MARIRTIAKKELVEFVRDWRTIMAILVIPLLMFPLLFILFPLLLASEAAELDAIEVEVIVQGSGVPQDLGIMLENASLNITYEPSRRWKRLLNRARTNREFVTVLLTPYCACG